MVLIPESSRSRARSAGASSVAHMSSCRPAGSGGENRSLPTANGVFMYPGPTHVLYTGIRSRLAPPNIRWIGSRRTFPMRSHNATSTAEAARASAPTPFRDHSIMSSC